MSELEKKYSVHSIFSSIQGEGYHSGRAAIFVRFSGCNMWNGEEEDRERDYKRTGARCTMFCDTVFKGHDPNNRGGRYSADDLWEVLSVMSRGPGTPIPGRISPRGRLNKPLIVLTGGEPSLQVGPILLNALLGSWDVAMETNGTGNYTDYPSSLWLTVSPKVNRHRIMHYPRQTRHSEGKPAIDELKVVYPSYNPKEYEDLPASHYYISPVDLTHSGLTMDGMLGEELTKFHGRDIPRLCVDFVKANPKWLLSLQTHKILGIE